MNDRLDARLRELHAEAVAQLSPHARTQLHNRLQAALAGNRRQRIAARVWIPAAALAAALALWLPWRPAPPPSAPVPASAPASMAEGDVVAPLDEAPDFYLWLASDDAVALAAE